MRKFIINVNGNQYEVEVEEVTDGASHNSKTSTTTSINITTNSYNQAPAPQLAPKAEEKRSSSIRRIRSSRSSNARNYT